MKKALKINEQIELLKKKGIIIDDKEKTKEILLDIGLHRLSLYWRDFNKNSDYFSKKKIKIKNIVKLYYLDFDLKNILLRYIYRIEVHFRAQLIYHVSNYYRDDPYWYMNEKDNVVNPNILKKLKNIYYHIRKQKVIIKHHKKYQNEKYVPAWKALEFMTFRQILEIYINLQEKKLKTQISKIYGIKSYAILESYFSAIINIRNLCSHNAVLYNFKQPKGIKGYHLFDRKYKNENKRMSQDINTSFRLIIFILEKISKNRSKDLIKNLEFTFNNNEHNELIKYIISNIIKFDLLITQNKV